MLLDRPDAKARDAVHLVFALENSARSISTGTDVDESEEVSSFRLLALESLVRMKLTSFATKTACISAI